MISSARRWALMHEHRGAPEATLQELVRHMSPVDLLLVEGFKDQPHAKLEVHRPALGKPLLCRGDPHIVAVASDTPITGVAVPVLALDDVAAIARFILAHFRLEAAGHGAAERRWLRLRRRPPVDPGRADAARGPADAPGRA